MTERDDYSVTSEYAHRMFPEAFVYFDIQCGDLVKDKIRFRLYRKRGTYAKGGGYVSRDRLLVVIEGRQFVWHPRACVWVRFSIGFKSKKG